MGNKIMDDEIAEAVELIIEAKQKAAEPEVKGRKRTLLARYTTYDAAKQAAADFIHEGWDPKAVQVRRHADFFGVYRRDWVK